MKYIELIQEVYSWVHEYHPDWTEVEKRKAVVTLANCITENDAYDFEMLDEGICPKCFEEGYLLTDGDRTTCFACGEIFTEVIF